jgi:hypothetical protein
MFVKSALFLLYFHVGRTRALRHASFEILLESTRHIFETSSSLVSCAKHGASADDDAPKHSALLFLILMSKWKAAEKSGIREATKGEKNHLRARFDRLSVSLVRRLVVP